MLSDEGKNLSGVPELLAPAGDWECARAAVENGADAIYFGLERFNARMRAKNFTQADLPALMEFLHRRGVRGYVTFNTLVFSHELAEAEGYLRTIIAAGADAAIVQDAGVCRMIRGLSPDFPIHASTQMTVTSAAGVRFVRTLGAQLVVLARENSLADIAAIRAEQAAREAADPAERALPLEVFVHGALCVAYSGQCLTSESLGGRSANRGECAQACRMPYGLVADGREVDLGDRKYLLSPQDLAGLEVLPEIIRSGVASLKIEGRLKSPEYVASVTRVYRREIDRLAPPALPAEVAEGGAPASASARYQLEMSFSRGLFTGWFRGIDNQKLAHGRFGTKRGVFLGEVVAVEAETATIRLAGDLKPGDGIVFDAGQPERGEEGGRVYQIDRQGDEAALRFGRGDIDFRRVRPGQRVWKTNDPALDRELRTTFEDGKIRFQRPVTIEVHGAAGQPMTLIASDGEGHLARVESARPLATADRQPLSVDRLRDQLGRLGGTPFRLGRLDSRLEGNVILPVSELNRMRREAVGELERQRAQPKRWTLRPEPLRQPAPSPAPAAGPGPGPGSGASAGTDAGERAGGRQPGSAAPRAEAGELIAVVRSLEQLGSALDCAGIAAFYCEFENPKQYREAVALFRARPAPGDENAGPGGGAVPPPPTIWVAPPRIFKPGEEWILHQVRSSEADGYLVRNYDHLEFFARDRRRGDFSLNVANPWAADHFIRSCGLERVTASYDLNAAQLEGLLQAAPAAWFDLTIHQHMPMFHMEHCVFCAFLSTGKDYRDCGRPCDRHRVTLRDRVGAELPLKADAGCRNTVFNNRAQTGAEYVPRFRELGARGFRVEFVNEGAAEVKQTLARYRELLQGRLSGAELWRDLKLLNQLGVTRGQMEAEPQVIRRKT